jgi:predicted Ser/Thr protein kinase
MPGQDENHDAVTTPLDGVVGAPGAAATPKLQSSGSNALASPPPPKCERYEILAEVGRGGMGIVYRARDRETNELIAVKVLRPELAGDFGIVERFKNELKLARKITHKNVCRMYDLHLDGSTVYITMEFIEGQSLRQILESGAELTVDRGIQVTRQICAALREVHNHGIVHRDLKPENVMLDQSGIVKIMDFGVARALNIGRTVTGAVLGTPAYMAPEQASGQRIDLRADIYALGLIAYELFTGVAAFAADTPVVLALKQVREMPVRPRALEPLLPPVLEKIILKCLNKSPGQRYQSVDELDSALAEIVQTEPNIADPVIETPRYPLFLTATAQDLPKVPRTLVRTLLVLIQSLYLVFYLLALWKFHRLEFAASQFLSSRAWLLVGLVLIGAVVGLALRLYLLSGIAFDYAGLGENFHRMFFAFLVLDELWALSPLLMAYKIGVGLAIAASVALAFLPFSQRTLMRMGYDRQE